MKVLFVDVFGNQEIEDCCGVPRIGDTIPLFYEPYPKVTNVIWFPEKVSPILVGKNIDVMIWVE